MTMGGFVDEVVDGSRVWEVGSYAHRPEGFLGAWQYHVASHRRRRCRSPV
jgi:hypothetical protein